MRIVDSCPICGERQFERLFTRAVCHPGDDLYANLLDLDYVRNYILFEKVLHRRDAMEFTFLLCSNCGLILFSPRPEDEDMAIKYAMMDELRDTELRDSQKPPPIYDDTRAREIHNSISRFREPGDLSVVDVGGANGYNLKYFAGRNSCFVVDYGERDLIDGVSYLCKTTSEIPDTMRFDVVLCCHTLEHMVDPVNEVMSIRRALSPGGLLYVEVPLGCHNEYEHTKNYLTHINFFSEGSVRQLFSECNMKLRYIKTKLTTVRWFRWLSLVAIAENGPSAEAYSNGYELTRQQMSNPLYALCKYLGFQRARFDRIVSHLAARLNLEHLKRE